VNKPTLIKVICLLVLVVILLLVPTFVKDLYLIHILIKVATSIGFAVSLWIMIRAGLISLGQGAFVGVGGYTVAILTTRYHLNIWLSFVLAGVLAGIVACLLGLFTVRLRGVFFLTVTFVFLEVLKGIYSSFQFPFGGAQGIWNIPHPQEFQLFRDFRVGFYYLALVYVAIVLFIAIRVFKSRVGLIFRGAGENPTLAAASGVDVRYYKLQAVAIGCFLTGIGGGILASYFTQASPTWVTFLTSLDILMYSLLGGLSTIAGPIAGASVLTLIGEALFGIGYFKSIVYGAIIILFVLFLPEGLTSLPRKLSPWIERIRGGIGND
jgi:branched-chain amino acid transport system permease protein